MGRVVRDLSEYGGLLIATRLRRLSELLFAGVGGVVLGGAAITAMRVERDVEVFREEEKLEPVHVLCDASEEDRDAVVDAADGDGADAEREVEGGWVDVPVRRDRPQRDVVGDRDVLDGGACPSGMLFVPEGNPLLGGERSSRHVGAYCIDRTEVTVGAFRRWLTRNPGAASPTVRSTDEFCNWTEAPAGRESHPINCVDWNEARAYCRGTGGSLPSDDQWEYAARGLDGRTYPWGDTWDASRVCSRTDGTCVAGSTSGDTSPFGVRDLASNLVEWTESRSVRGASWDSADPVSARAAIRFVDDATNRYDFLGFRCVRGSR